MTDKDKQLLLDFVKLIEFEHEQMNVKEINYRKLLKDFIVCRQSKMQ